MNTVHVKYLVIGAGVAGSAAVQAIRQRDKEGMIMLVGQEIHRPYQRGPISKSLLRRQAAKADLMVHAVGWYTERNVQLSTGRRAAQIDAARHHVTLDNGQDLSFDRLLIATGASPRSLTIPGSNLPSLYYLRTLEDVDILHHAIDKALNEGRPHGGSAGAAGSSAKARGRATVIGASSLGVEVAASLAHLGIGVDLVTGAATPWSRFAGETAGRFLTRLLEDHGIRVHNNQRAIRLEGDGRVQRVVLSHDDQPIDCDFVVGCVGVVANKDLLRNTPIVAEKAILVNEHCQTSERDIYAAGDCAAVKDPLFGKYRPADLWDTAAVTGALAGANMAGEAQAFGEVTHFRTEVFDIAADVWGDARHVSRRLLRGTPSVESPAFFEIGIGRDDRVNQAMGVSKLAGPRDADAALLPELVRQRFRIDGNEELLKDPHSDLRSLLGR
jgi:3-phenylpropionate/trans-cinnamate dioxygenase ferredoxin reductase subunit